VSWEEARAQFPVLDRFAYLNAGSVGPLARATVEAAEAEEQHDLRAGRGSRTRFEEVMAMRAGLREAVAGVAATTAEHVALTASTSEACRIAVAALELGPDDEIVTTDVEHFGLLGPVGASPARVRVAAVRERPAAEALDGILAEVTPRTRLIALSHVAWTTGHVLPVAELAERGGPALLVDGAQSIGAVPVDVTPFDFYTVSGQKWLCGPDATGALVVREPERWAVALPSYLSQDGYEADGTFTPRAGAARYEPGWTPSASLVGLRTAMELVPEGRFERARAMAERCRDLLAERVEVVTEPGQATLVTWRADRPAEAVVRALEAGVIIREMPKLGWLRASVGWWTNENDLQRLVAAVT
jgi:L-cysteine/cystine lyase